MTYRIDSRADWVDDTSGGASCTTAGSSADYMKVSTSVSWPQMGTRKPVMLESLITPSVRAFDASQGSLSVQVAKADGSGLSGLPINLSGAATLSNVTSSSGCVLWGYLTAGSGYMVGFSLPGYVAPDGSPSVSAPVAVVGGETSSVAFQYDLAGIAQTDFTTRRPSDGVVVASYPQQARVLGNGVSLVLPVAADRLTSSPLFPATQEYTIQPDTCAASELPVTPLKPNPKNPPAPAQTTVAIRPGMTTSSTMLLPPIDVRVSSDGQPKLGAMVRVTTGCGTVYRRRTNAQGRLDDPGFPYAQALAICVSDGTRMRDLPAYDNRNFNRQETSAPVDLTAQDQHGACS